MGWRHERRWDGEEEPRGGGGVLCFGVTLGLFGAGDEDGVGCAAPMHPPGFGGTNITPPMHHHGCGVSVRLFGGPRWGQCPPPPHSATTEGHLLFFLPPPPPLFMALFFFFMANSPLRL